MNATSAATAQIHEEPYVNISFPIQGQQLPADHGYLVYSAISRAFPALHSVDWLGIELISGFPSGPGLIALDVSQAASLRSGRGSTFRLRIPAGHYRDVLPLAGKRLDIRGHQIRLGLPVARPLEPAPSLYARVVTIKKFTEPDPFLEAVNRQLDALDVRGTADLPRDEQGRYRRRIVTIHGKSVVGFSVAVQLIVILIQRLSASLKEQLFETLFHPAKTQLLNALRRAWSKFPSLSVKFFEKTS
jgi:CRISPR-associated protein Cas6